MPSVESLHNIPENHTIDFITPEISDDYAYIFRKLYLPAALLRLYSGENFVGEGLIHMTGRGIVGYHEARDYFHVSPDYDQTLRSRQGKPDDQTSAATAFGFDEELPNVSQVIGLKVDPSLTTDHFHGKYYTVDADLVPVQAIDPYSRLGLFRLLGEPAKIDWFVEDIDPSIETALKLRHIV